MPATEQAQKPLHKKPLPNNLSDLERLLLERQDDGFDRVEGAIDRLIKRTPDPKMILAAASSLVLGVFVLIVYLVSIIAVGNGVDVKSAAEAARVVVEATRTETVVTSPATAATPDAPAVKATRIESSSETTVTTTPTPAEAGVAPAPAK